MSQRPHKRPRFTAANREIKGPGTWSCIESLVGGPSCIPSWRIDRNSSENEFKIYPETYNSERECREGKCLARPTEFALDRDLFSEMATFLPTEDLKTLSSHDPLARDMFAESLAIADAAQRLSDGFFLAALGDTDNYAANDWRQLSTPTERFWANLRRAVLAPEDVIEQEAGILAIELITNALKEFNAESMYFADDISSLLRWVRNDREFLSRVAELSPNDSSLVWFVSEQVPDFVLNLQQFIGPDSNQAIMSSIDDLGSFIDELVEDSRSRGPISRNLVSVLGTSILSSHPDAAFAQDAPSFANLVLYLIETSAPSSTLQVALDVISSDRFDNVIENSDQFASRLVDWLNGANRDGLNVGLKDRIFARLLDLASFTNVERRRILDAVIETRPDFRASLAKLEG